MTIAQPDRTLAATGLILAYAAIVGLADNYVRAVAGELGLWQVHLSRSVLALMMLFAAAPFLGLRMRPKRWGGVVARSALHGVAIMIYFGALGFLPVAIVAAGLFTAPIFVLLISRLVYGHRIGPFRILAVGLGFLGVILVLGPSALAGATLAAGLPVLAGALYGLGNIATRQWCEGETAECLLAGFFVSLGVLGLIGLAVMTALHLEVPPGSAGFILRGFVWPSGYTNWVLLGMALGSLVGVGLSIRAYQLTDAGRASVLEYMILPSSAFWTWIVWDEALDLTAWAGMALIAGAGLLIALRAKMSEDSGSETRSNQLA
ncbi:DMT family transporter [Xinfangfangia sp. CPCC 101601]|uniref:DMT family transporter n=1 Tax=Pseudogemmobacter lacusdianii TaxID=3069608 RepID=A0ABU0VST8_9RHOB|nr:DMT family transporter [Xinfangfangia sp. CPCC 101601]MDQ2064792.1 DMT family transporter [Xinfangfangia sp. CPCC 101601]